MKKTTAFTTIAAAVAASLLLAAPAHARDTIVNVALADVLAMPEAKTKLSGKVRFYLAGQATPQAQRTMGEGVSNRKTYAAAKTDEAACKWVVLSTLIAFDESALREGANAVVGLVSFYKESETRSDTTIECHAGNMLAGAALKGTYAKLPD